MSEELKQFEALLLRLEGLEYKTLLIAFEMVDEREGFQVAEAIGVLEDAELIYLSILTLPMEK